MNTENPFKHKHPTLGEMCVVTILGRQYEGTTYYYAKVVNEKYLDQLETGEYGVHITDADQNIFYRSNRSELIQDVTTFWGKEGWGIGHLKTEKEIPFI